MTREDMAMIMKYFQTAYGKFYEEADSRAVMDIWMAHFKDQPAEMMMAAAHNYVAMNEYPPTIAGIKKQINLLNPDKGNEKETLWVEITKAANNGLYGYAEEFEKLSEPCKKFVGTASVLKEFAMMESGTLNTVVKGQFMRQVDAILERQEAQNMLPENIKNKLISSISLEDGGTR